MKFLLYSHGTKPEDKKIHIRLKEIIKDPRGQIGFIPSSPMSLKYSE